MKLIIVSGRSGSGKSTALHVLEDLGFYCIDNLPIGLLFPLTREAASQTRPGRLGKMAVSIDARNLSGELANFEEIYRRLQETGVTVEIIFLDADEQSLLQRFHATRRKHPLSDDRTSLREAITSEKKLLEPLSKLSDLYVNTTGMSMYELRDMVKQRVVGRKDQELALLFQSFGFKHGVPLDSDYVFDVRCLPNPYWMPDLRAYSGRDEPVRDYLAAQPEVEDMFQDIVYYLRKWLPRYAASERSYMTIAIGCTGGHHRSVYIAERLVEALSRTTPNLLIRHRDLP